MMLLMLLCSQHCVLHSASKTPPPCDKDCDKDCYNLIQLRFRLDQCSTSEHWSVTTTYNYTKFQCCVRKRTHKSSFEKRSKQLESTHGVQTSAENMF